MKVIQNVFESLHLVDPHDAGLPDPVCDPCTNVELHHLRVVMGGCSSKPPNAISLSFITFWIIDI